MSFTSKKPLKKNRERLMQIAREQRTYQNHSLEWWYLQGRYWYAAGLELRPSLQNMWSQILVDWPSMEMGYRDEEADFPFDS